MLPRIICLSFVFLLSTVWPATAAALDTNGNSRTFGDGPARAFDRPHLEIAQRIPSFGGMFHDKNGILNVYLVNATELLNAAPENQVAVKTKIRTAVKEVFGHRYLRSEEIKLLPGRYRFLELHAWFMRLHEHTLGAPGVVGMGIDKAKNRIGIWILDKDTKARIEAELHMLNIPIEAVDMEISKPVRPAEILRDQFRPVMGGLQLSCSDSLCTVGFNAIGLGGLRGFLTNSHCTDIEGEVTNITYYQPSSPDFIGFEIADPPHFSGFPCPANRVCRWSDSAFAEYDPSVSNTIGLVTRTIDIDSIDINLDDPAFFVIDEAPFPGGGMRLHKMGRTTGWTVGEVIVTCWNFNVDNSNITFLCQDIVRGSDVIVGAGDSGSPVFGITPSNSEVVLFGILWGRTDDSTFIFSAMDNVEFELGNLTTF